VSKRLVLVEGPDDVAALLEIGKRMFGATAGGVPGVPSRMERDATLTVGAATIAVRSAKNAKDGLPEAVMRAVDQLPPLVAGDEARHDRVAFVFDPDGDPPNAFVDRVHGALGALSSVASPWSIARDASGDRWNLSRAGEEPLALRGVAWRADGLTLGGLDDLQNLERLLCRVLGAAYPALEPMVARWLGEVRAARPPAKAIKWKAAVLLWAALVDEGATSDAGIASRFLGQHRFPGGDGFARFVAPQLDAAGLREPLAWVFSTP